MLDLDAKVQRVTLSEQVEGFIRDHITSQRIAPGDSLPSSVQLAEQFGVSRAIVREALKSLEAKGMITIANGKRPRVSPLTNQLLVDYFHRVSAERDATLIDLLELRKGIEMQSASLAAIRRTPQELDELWSLIERMRGSIGHVEHYLDYDVSLHMAIARSSHNRMFAQIVDSIRVPMRDTQREGQVMDESAEMRESIQFSHEILVQLIDHQDPDGAARCMGMHFDGSIEAIQRTRDGLPLTITNWELIFPVQSAAVSQRTGA